MSLAPASGLEEIHQARGADAGAGTSFIAMVLAPPCITFGAWLIWGLGGLLLGVGVAVMLIEIIYLIGRKA